MNLLVCELNGACFQPVTTGSSVIHVTAIRPHIYKHLAPAGSFYIQIQDANGKKIANSNSLTAANISASNYFHGYVRFDVSASLFPETQYRIALKSSGYSYSDSAYIGWCTDFDLRKYTLTGFQTGEGWALDMEIWQLKTIGKAV